MNPAYSNLLNNLGALRGHGFSMNQLVGIIVLAEWLRKGS